MKKMIILLGTTGLVVGWVLGYYAHNTWWSILLAVAVVFSVAFILKLTEIRRKIPRSSK